MRRLVVLAYFLSSLLPSLVAQQPDTMPAAAAAAKAADKGKKDYSQESFVIEQVRTRFRFDSDGTGRKETIARVRVQSEAGVEQWGQVMIGYNSANERVEIPYVRVLKKDGSVVTAPADSVQDLSAPVEREAPVYTDYRQKHITVPGLRPGEVLEYDLATFIHTPLAPGQFWTEYDFDKTNIVLDEELELDIPKDRTIKLKTKPGFDPKISGRKWPPHLSLDQFPPGTRGRRQKQGQGQEEKEEEKGRGRSSRGSADHLCQLGRQSDAGMPVSIATVASPRLRFAPKRRNSPRA